LEHFDAQHFDDWHCSLHFSFESLEVQVDLQDCEQLSVDLHDFEQLSVVLHNCEQPLVFGQGSHFMHSQDLLQSIFVLVFTLSKLE